MTTNSNSKSTLDDVIQQLQGATSLPAELLEIFSEEAEDHLRTIYDGLGRLQQDRGDMSALADVRRASHTLKGAAGAVNLQSATRLAHRMEDLLDQLAEQKQKLTEEQLKLLLATADQLEELTTGEFEVETVAQQVLQLYQGYAGEMGEPDQAAMPTEADRSAAPTHFQPEKLESPRLPPVSAVEPLKTGDSGQYLRVPLDRLDDLVGLLGEMMVNRSKFQHQLNDFESRIEDMQSAMERLREVTHYVEAHQIASSKKRKSPSSQSRSQRFGPGHNMEVTRSGPATGSGEFDELEFDQYSEFNLLSQTLSEADHDAEIMSGEFRTVKTAFDSLLRRQHQLNREAQKSLMRIRMVPLSGILSRLERTVRTVSSKLGRKVDLNVIGERIELDKTVIDEITDPLLHLIRNGIDHGVEDPETRAAAGKPETAQLQIKAVNHGTQVSLVVSDDGAGINLAKVREKAIQQGLIEDAQVLSDEQLHALIFRPGFSTAAELTDVSGRGVGMDVVGETIRKLKGTISVDSKSGVGTTFTIQLPTSVGVTRALLVESAGQSFAIPMPSIQKIQTLEPNDVATVDGEHSTEFEGRNLRLIELAEHLKLGAEKPSRLDIAVPMLIIGESSDEVAVTVDSILGSQDIVIKSLGDHLKKIRGIVGATIAGDGSVIPILDTTDLSKQQATDLSLVAGYQFESTPVVRRNLAMVIDDSISVRRVTENILTTAGWDVVTAKDGVDALETLAQLDETPDVFLCDMEMPRMDGLELVRQIREQREFELTPIVMVTSRASEKHRNKAFEAGATDYVVKPYNTENLLELITQLVQAARETVAGV